MPLKAEYQLKLTTSTKALSHLAILQGATPEDEHNSNNNESVTGSITAVGRHSGLSELVEGWIKKYASLNAFEGCIDLYASILASSSNNLVVARTLYRELLHAKKSIELVLNDLLAVKDYLEGHQKLSNHVKELITCYRKGLIPATWKKSYQMTSNKTFLTYLEDIWEKAEYYVNIYQRKTSSVALGKNNDTLVQDLSHVYQSNLLVFDFQLSKLYHADALIMASRQLTAKVSRTSLNLNMLPVHHAVQHSFCLL